MDLKLDCRHFRGEKPCAFHCGCAGCAHYEPMGTRILIVKLDAIGDVARTTTILRALRRKYKPCHITWLVAPTAEEMLRGNPEIDAVLPYRLEMLEPLRVQKFDLVLSLDKTARATAVGMWADGREKLGFGLSPFGTPYPLNAEAEYAFALGLDDDLKFRHNARTYQEIIFEAIRLQYERDEYAIEIDAQDRAHAAQILHRLGVSAGEVVVGLNLGGGSAFANKMWGAKQCVRFLIEMLNEVECKALLFGAEREEKAMEEILEADLPRVLAAGTDNTIRQFQALVERCDVLVTGDSLGMHLAIAAKRPVIVLFGPTCAAEIELYDRGEKIVSTVECAPCYRPQCRRQPTCMKDISPKPVVEAVVRQLKAQGKLSTTGDSARP